MEEPSIVAIAISALMDSRALMQKLTYMQKIMGQGRLAFVTRCPVPNGSSTIDWTVYVKDEPSRATLSIPFRWYGTRNPGLLDAFESVRQANEQTLSQANE